MTTKSIPQIFKLILISFIVFQPSLLFADASDIAKIDPKSEKITISLSEINPLKDKIYLSKVDGSIFFLNNSSKEFLTIDIDFSGSPKHCWSDNLEFTDKQHLVSKDPILPNDFALVCFPQKGIYPIQFYFSNGSKQSSEVVVGSKK